MVDKPNNKEGQSIKLSLENLLFLFQFQAYKRETWNDLFNILREMVKRKKK